MVLAGGKIRACAAPNEAPAHEREAAEEDSRTYRRFIARFCCSKPRLPGEGCEFLTGVQKLLKEADLTPEKRANVGFPNRKDFSARLCARDMGLARTIRLPNGAVALTVPTELRALLREVQSPTSEGPLRSMASGLISWWDEFHKDSFLREIEGTVELSRAITASEVPCPTILLPWANNLDALPALPNYFHPAPGDDSLAGAPQVLRQIWFALRPILDLAGNISEYFTKVKAGPESFERNLWSRISRRCKEGEPKVNSERVVARLERPLILEGEIGDILAAARRDLSTKKDDWGRLGEKRRDWFRTKLIPRLAALKVNEEFFSSTLTGKPTVAEMLAALSYELRVSPNNQVELAAMIYERRATPWNPDERWLPMDPFSHASRVLRESTPTLEAMQAALDQVETELSSEQIEWDEFLRVALAARFGVLWAELGESEDGGPLVRLRVLDADVDPSLSDDDGPPIPAGPAIRPRWHPFRTLLEAGAVLVLMSATPYSEEYIRGLLGVESVNRIPYPKGAERPKVRYAIELGTKGIYATLVKHDERYFLRDDTERLLNTLADEIAEPFHVVARNKRERQALRIWASQRPTSKPRVEVHMFRDQSSMGVEWLEVGTGITVMLGPPKTPLFQWHAHVGLARTRLDLTSDVADESALLDRDWMAHEFCQTSCRTVQLSPDAAFRRTGKVILLNAYHDEGFLREASTKYGIEIESWKTVPVTGETGPVGPRAARLVAAVRGLPILAGSAARVVTFSRDRGWFTKQDLRRQYGGNDVTWAKGLKAAFDAGFLDMKREGKRTFYRER
ncbi:MAG: hypothetical protein HYT80_05230 [Euryarchaeota archaeon]|nr:hypothetical protein [Euryarchaeota archaeon]